MNKQLLKSLEKNLDNYCKTLSDAELAELIGEGEWIKDSAYQVHKYGDRYFVLVVYNSSSKCVLENTLCEIEEKNIGSYLENWK
jgi:hypothetical protein